MSIPRGLKSVAERARRVGFALVGQKAPPPARRKFDLEALEPRVLLSASVPTVQAAVNHPSLTAAAVGGVDLQITNFTAPASAQVGDTIILSWTVTNNGDQTAVAGFFGWDDSIQLSADNYSNNATFPDDGDLVLVKQTRTQDLAPGASYTVTKTLKLRSLQSGPLYFVLRAGDYQSSDVNPSNNLQAKAITVTVPNVDLTATATAGTTGVLGGLNFPVSITVTNQGTQTATAMDSDKVYLSYDSVLDEYDLVVGSLNSGLKNPLAAGASYTISSNLYISDAEAAGPQYFIFVANGAGDQGETNTGNNTVVKPITLSHPTTTANNQADLRVTSFTVPPTAEAGSTISISWTVKNFGSLPTSGNWRDSILLLDDFSQSLGFGDGPSSPLAPGASYTGTLNVTIPSGTPAGTSTLQVNANGDYSTYINEGYEGNRFVRPIEITAAINSDLVIESPTAPANVILGQSFPVSFVVRNQGTDATPAGASWRDSVVFSTNSIFGDADDYYVQDVESRPPNGGQLAANATYLNDLMVTLPSGVTGSGYLFFVADSSLGNPETNEANNRQSVFINVSGPDLVPSALTGPASARLGDTISLSYTLTNNGTETASGSRYDSYYLSADAVLDSSDIFITSENAFTALNAGDQITVSKNLQLPTSPVGARYIIVKTDDGDDLNETGETNNTVAFPITLSGANLTVTAASSVTSATLGDTISVSWTVKNTGNAPTTASVWYERFYISSDNLLDGNDTEIGSTYHEALTALGINGEYTGTGSFTIPNTALGDRYLLVVADGYFMQAESNDSDNLRAMALHLDGPDLTVTDFTAPATATLGVAFPASWTVKNNGAFPAKLNWTDELRLSADATLDSNDFYLDTASGNNSVELAPGASYTINRNVTINGTSLGSYTLFLTADAYGGINETNEANNQTSRTITVGAVDLVPTNVVVPASTQSGQTFNVTWKDTNNGNVPVTKVWYDTVTLRNVGTGQIIAQQVVTYDPVASGNLAAGAALDRTTSFTLPEGPAGVGQFEVVVTTDSLLHIAESNVGGTAETNNAFTAPQITSTLAPYADLVASNVAVPANLESGQTFNVTWTITNSGNKATSGDFYDRLVIVNTTTGQTLATANILYDSALRGNIAPGETRQQQYSFHLPDGAAGVGELHFDVTTDQFQGVMEFNAGGTAETNNVTPTLVATSILASYPDLVVSQITTPTGASSGKAATVQWTVTNSGTKVANGPWNDRVVIRNLTTNTVVFDETVAFAGASLAAGASSLRTFNFTLPEGPAGAGPFEVTVTADNGNGVLEIASGYDAEANNARTGNFTSSLSPYPDLVVTNIAAPGNATDGSNVEVTWTVTNQGDGPAGPGWVDHLYLSTDSTIGEGDLDLGAFPITMTLAAGGSIQRTQVISLPFDLQGTYRLLVRTDEGTQVTEFNGSGTAETNNVTADDQPVVVTLAARPNLQVTAITAPATAHSGQPTSIQFTITNTGSAATSNPHWADSVFLSTDNIYDVTDEFLGNFDNGSYLEPGQSYVTTANVTIPNGFSGPFYFFARADVTFFSAANNKQSVSYVRESNESDNVLGASTTTAITLTPPPDLQISVNAPTDAFSGQTLTVSWTVTNSGTGPTPNNNWDDVVYLSTDTTIDSGDRVLGSFHHAPTLVRVISGNSVSESLEGGPLNPGETYKVTQTYTLPVGVSGDFHVLVKTDVNNVVYEHTLENNNVGSDPLHIILTPPPDLEVESISAPTFVLAGQSLKVDYRVTNFGSTRTPEGSWRDQIYLSTDRTFGPGDLYLGEVTHNGALDSDQSYDGTATFTLPPDLNGTYYVFVATDTNNGVFELDNGNNSLFSDGTVTVESRPADLAVLSASAPALLQAGGSVQVRWTVGNLGIGVTNAAGWSDTVYFSPNADLSNARELGSFAHAGALAVGQSYFNAQLVNIPLDLSGPGYLFVRTGANVYENGAVANNLSTGIAVNVDQKLSDLEVSNVTAPANVSSPGQITVNWKVSNIGVASTNVGYWNDEIWLVSTAPGGAAFQIGSRYRGAALASGASYNASATIDLPLDLAGTYTVQVRTGVQPPYTPGGVYEAANTANNVASALTTTTSTLAPVGDLVVDAVSGPVEVLSGQNVTVNWTVRNAAAAITGGWRDVFYLSRDPVLDPRTDVFLGYSDHNAGLGANASYSKTASFTVPRGLSGTYYIFAVTDSTNNVYERGVETNNTARSSATTLVTLAPPADLVAGILVVPATGTAAQNASITFTVTNNGTNPARGSWTDSLYLSANTSFDVTDQLIGRLLHDAGDLAPSASYTSTINAPLPGVAPGTYHVILRSDIFNHVPELNEPNNFSASIDQTSVTVPALALGTPASGLISAGRAFYYKVDVAAGQTLLFSLNASNASSANELYVSYGKVPTRSDFDFGFKVPNSEDQEVIVPETEAGTYYVLAYGATGASSFVNTYDLTASLVPFAVRSIGLETAGNAGSSTIEIEGARFTEATTFQLLDPNGNAIAATRTIFVDASHVYATFDLTGRAVGAYDVQATNPGNQAVQLNDALNVEVGRGSHITAGITGLQSVRVNLNYTAYIDFVNDGDSDAAVPSFVIQNLTGTPVGFDRTALSPVDLQILGASDGVLGGILRPGERRTIPFYFTASPMPKVELRLYTITDTDQTPTDFRVVESALRSNNLVPSGLSPAEFAAAFAQLKTQIGTTWGDYQRMLARNASLVTLADGANTGAVPMLNLEFQRALAATGSSLSGTVTSSDASLSTAGRLITAVNTGTGEAFSGFTLRDGSFVFGRVTPGNYELSVDAFLVSSGGAAQVASGTPVTGLSLALERGGTVRGTALADGSGQVIPGISIRLQNDSGGIYSVQTDVTGAYSITGVPAGTYRIVADAPGKARLTVTNIVVASNTDTQFRNLNFVPETTIGGTVSLQPGGPSSPLQILVHDVTDSSKVFAATIIDPSFSIGGLPAGTYRVDFSAAGYAPKTVDYTVTAGQALSVTSPILLRAGSATGTVTSLTTQSPSGVIVGVYQGTTLVASAQSDAQGAFSITGILPGNYTLKPIAGSASFFNTQNLTIAAGQDLTGLTVTLLPGGAIGGVVRNSAGSQPLAGVEVFLSTPSGALISAVTDAQGRYKFESLSLGAYTTFVRGTSAAAVSSTVTDLTGTALTANFSVTATATVGGQLQTAGGAPIVGAVSLIENGSTIATAYTNAEGRYLFLVERAGTFSLQAVGTGASFAPVTDVTVAAGSALQRNFVAGTGMLNLTITDSQSVSGTTVLLSLVLATGERLSAGSAKVDASGTASFANLQAGNYEVTVLGGANRGATSLVAVTAGATSTTVALTQLSSLSGQLTATGGAGVANATIMLRSADGQVVAAAGADFDGKYEITHLAPGTYEMIAVADGFETLIAPSVVVGASATTANRTLTASTTTITGQALTASGQPIRSGLVTVIDSAGRLVGSTGLQNDGTFTITSAVGTGLQISIRSEGFTRAVLTGINAVAGSTTPLAASTLQSVGYGGSTAAAPAGNGFASSLAGFALGGSANAIGATAAGSGSLFGFLASLLITAKKEADHIYFRDVPEPCTPEAAAQTLSERVHLLNAVSLEEDAFRLIAEQQGLLRTYTAILSGAWLAATVDTASQFTLLVASVLPLGTAIRDASLAAKAAIAAENAAEVAEDISDAAKAAKAIADAAQKRKEYGELAQLLINTGNNARSLVEQIFDLKTTFYGIVSVDSPADAAARYDSFVSKMNAIVGLVSDLTSTIAKVLGKEAVAEVLGVAGAVGGLAGAIASIPSFINSIKSNTEQLRSHLDDVKSSYEGVQGAQQTYHRMVLQANKRLDEYINALQKAGCQPIDPRPDHNTGNGVPGSNPASPFGPGTGPGGSGGAGGRGPSGSYNPSVDNAHDPNDITGPLGFGDDHWVNARDPLAYTIRFENQPSATAPAQQVIVIQQLDSDLDWRTLRLGDFGWGGVTVELPGTQSFYSGRIDLIETLGFVVDVTAFIDVQTGVAKWTLTTIDPLTGEQPIDPQLGFLPPDNANGDGGGFVSYTVRPLKIAATGARIDAQATIFFDQNAPIDTPAIFNTIDSSKPVSSVTPLPATRGSVNFDVAWTASDDDGSAIANVDLYVSDNGAPAQIWLEKTTLERATFRGEPGHTYTFYTIARDNAGNVQAAGTSAPTTTLVTGAGNAAPVVQGSKTLTVLEDTPTGLGISAPTDVDDDTPFVIVNSVPAPTFGTVRRADNVVVKAGDLLTVAQLAALTFNPLANVSGAAGTFSYTANDGQGGTASQTVTIDVTAQNDAPLLDVNKIVTAIEDGSDVLLAIGAPTDTENDPLTITVTAVPIPAKGLVKLADGTTLAVGATLTSAQLQALKFSVKPDAFGAAGAFTYAVSDGQGGIASQTVTLNITGVNDAPVVEANKATRALVGTPLAIVAPLDVDGDTLAITVTALPDAAKGVLQKANGTPVTLGSALTSAELAGLRYVPVADVFGAAGAFSYSVSDGTAPAVVRNVALTNVTYVTIDKKNPKVFTDADGDKVTVSLGGNGSGFLSFVGDLTDNANLDTILLTGTDLASAVKIVIKKNGSSPGTTEVRHLLTSSLAQALGTVAFPATVKLGDGLDDATPELLIGGGAKSISLGNLASNASIRIGSDLDPTVSANGAAIAANSPAFVFGEVLGAGVTVDVHGGLKSVVGKSWNFAGTLSTLGSIGSIKLAGSLAAAITADAASVLTGTAQIGAISVGGSFTSPVLQAEGAIASLAVAGALQSTITATSLGKVAAANIADTTITTTGAVGDIAAIFKNATGAITVIDNLAITASKIGKITATAAGTTGLTAVTGIVDSSFTSGSSIGDVTATATSKNAATTYVGIKDTGINAAGAVGKLKASNFDTVQVYAGGKIAGIEANAGKNAAAATITDSTFLAGQATTLLKSADLANAGIGSIKAGGGITDSVFAAKGNIGAVTGSGDAIGVTLVAGVSAGADHTLLTGDDSYHRHASLSSVKFLGALRNSSFIAGLNPGTDFVWGSGTGSAADTAGATLAGFTKDGKIGAISAGISTLANPAANPFGTPALFDHIVAIEGISLTSVQIGKIKLSKITNPVWIDANQDGIEDASETIIRTLG